MPPKNSSVTAVNVPSYAELLSSSRKTTKTKSGLNGEKKKKKALVNEETKKSSSTKEVNGNIIASSLPDPTLEVVCGCRVVLASSGLFGTVRFVGEASFQAGTWVGIELDSEQGKNDGVVKGHRYFTCPPNHGIFVRPTSFDIISFPSGPVAPDPALADTKPSLPPKAKVPKSEDGDMAVSATVAPPIGATISIGNNQVATSSYANLVAKTQSGRKSGTASPGRLSSSPRRTSTDSYGGFTSDDHSSPARSSNSAPRNYSGNNIQTDNTSQPRRLSPRRRTSALVSSIDDVLASMEYAASDINKKEKKEGKKSGKKSGSLSRPKSPFERQGSQSRPKSPFERNGGMSAGGSDGIYSSEEERMFVENLVELVAKSPVVSDYLKTEIEKHQQATQASNVASKSDVSDLQSRVNHLETVSISSNTFQDPMMESLMDHQAVKTEQSIEALSHRMARLEEAVSQPLQILTQQLSELDMAVARLSGEGGNTESVDQVKAHLSSVRALALQAFNALEVSH